MLLLLLTYQTIRVWMLKSYVDPMADVRIKGRDDVVLEGFALEKGHSTAHQDKKIDDRPKKLTLGGSGHCGRGD